jgi:hypothetical protein
MIIAWWSAGVTSAIATKLALDEFGVENVRPIYFGIASSHPDNARFQSECEAWYGCKIETVVGKYADQFEVIKKTRYINGAAGARCTGELKKSLRQRIERELDYEGQVFGFEFNKKEVNRAIRFKEQYPDARPLFPLIERRITKPEALALLEAEGIERPVMYKLGYPNNNCIGCVKGGAGYWNQIKKDFPDHFARMAALERDLEHTCLSGQYLDELPASAGRHQEIIMPNCGNFCDIEFSDLTHPLLAEVLAEPRQLRLL